MRLRAALIVGVAMAALSLPTARAEDPPAVVDEAPDFTLKNASGEDVTLSSMRGEQHVLLAFYPRDFTPG